MLSDDKELTSQPFPAGPDESSLVEQGFENLLKKIYPGVDLFRIDHLGKLQEPDQFPVFDYSFLQSSSFNGNTVQASSSPKINQSSASFVRGSMTKIRVDPPVLQNCSQNIQTSSATLSSVSSNLSSCGNGAPSYDGQFGPKVRAIAGDASSQSGQLSERFSNLASWLANKAQQFQNADNASAAVLGSQYNNLAWMSTLAMGYPIYNSLPFKSLLNGLFPKGVNLWNSASGNVLNILTPEGIKVPYAAALDFIKKADSAYDLSKIYLLVGSIQSGNSYPGQLIFYGPDWYKKLADIENLTHIKVDKFLNNKLTSMNSIKESGLLTLLFLTADWVKAGQEYGFLTPKFNAAFSVEAFKAAISVAAGIAGFIIGGALGLPTTGPGAVITATAGAFLATQAVDYLMDTPLTKLLPQAGSSIEKSLGAMPGFFLINAIDHNQQFGQKIGTKVAEAITGPACTELNLTGLAIDKLADLRDLVR